MSNEELLNDLSRSESETLDFKATGYDLAGGRNAFVKDIIAMYNTPRDIDAKIILGVSYTPEKGCAIIGLDKQFDDADFQRAFGEDRAQPRPKFSYQAAVIHGKQVGTLRIPSNKEGPCTFLKDYENFQAGAVYYRKGSENDRAVGEALRSINRWFLGGPQPDGAPDWGQSWSNFEDSADSFNSSRVYMLVSDRIARDTTAPVRALALVPWHYVIDFDPQSEDSGLLFSIYDALAKRRVLHRVVKGDYGVSSAPGTRWFFARGLAGRLDSIEVKSHKEWLRAYKQELGRQLVTLANSVSPTPVSFVVVWQEGGTASYLRTLLEEVQGAFGDLATITVVSSDGASLQPTVEDVGGRFIDMSLRTLCAGIATHFAIEDEVQAERRTLPTSGGAQIEVDPDDALWLSENLEVLYSGAGLVGDESADGFRKGAEVSWRNLTLHHDCDRTISVQLRHQVLTDLTSRRTVRINLYHAPGAGGSTVGRRLLWDLKTSFPACVLTQCHPRATAERIAKLVGLTESPVVVLVDGGSHPEREIDELFEMLKANQTPSVLVQVLRRFQQVTAGSRAFWLDSNLNDDESDRFREAYCAAAPDRAEAVTKLSRTRSNNRSAFYFGLTAFDHDFQGLPVHVSRRTIELSEPQRRALTILSLALYYGQSGIKAQAFAQDFGFPRNQIIDFRRLFSEGAAPAVELLVETQDSGEWRIAHQLIAYEVLIQMLAPSNSQERDRVWRQQLSAKAKDFADFCRGDDPEPSDYFIELIRRVFIYRDNSEVIGTERSAQSKFSHIIEDIPTVQGRAEVLRHLAEAFRDQAHIHGHLARFLGVIGEFEEALITIDFALAMQPQDSVLHHVRGMILRKKIASLDATDSETVTIAESASNSFEEARRYDPDQEYGYISEVQMLIGLLDGLSGGEGIGGMADRLATLRAHPYLRGALDRAEDLLDRVYALYVNESPSNFATECRARLSRLYGDFGTALQLWDNLLTRQDIARPPIRRQIVWTILRRGSSAWEKLSERDITRVRQLLESNLEEESKDSTSLRLWLRAIRHASSPPNLDGVIERVAYWKANTGSLDAAYYLYVLHALKAMDGSQQSLADTERALEECRALSRYRRDRTRSFEWIGHGQGVSRLVHQSRLGDWEGTFWQQTRDLARLRGRVKSIDAQQKGLIEVPGGLEAFFVPSVADIHKDRDENSRVEFFLGFSYDGPRAWSVERAEL